MSSRRQSIAQTLEPGVRLRVFHEMLRQATIPPPVPEYRFDLTRRWRFDFAFPREKVALEVEGGVWTRGRHLRGLGFLKDIEKYNRAAVLGWRLIRCTPATLCTRETIDSLAQALGIAPPSDVPPSPRAA